MKRLLLLLGLLPLFITGLEAELRIYLLPLAILVSAICVWFTRKEKKTPLVNFLRVASVVVLFLGAWSFYLAIVLVNTPNYSIEMCMITDDINCQDFEINEKGVHFTLENMQSVPLMNTTLYFNTNNNSELECHEEIYLGRFEPGTPFPLTLCRDKVMLDHYVNAEVNLKFFHPQEGKYITAKGGLFGIVGKEELGEDLGLQDSSIPIGQ